MHRVDRLEMTVATDLVEHVEPSTETERAPWQVPSMTRFGAAGAEAGNSIANNEDGDTSKS
jgi:hypothetical protein